MYYIFTEDELSKLTQRAEIFDFVIRSDKKVYDYMIVIDMMRVFRVRAINKVSLLQFLKLKYKMNISNSSFETRGYPKNDGRYGKVWETDYNNSHIQIYRLN